MFESLKRKKKSAVISTELGTPYTIVDEEGVEHELVIVYYGIDLSDGCIRLEFSSVDIHENGHPPAEEIHEGH